MDSPHARPAGRFPMASISDINPFSPIILDPAQFVLDRPNVTVCMDTVGSIRLDGERAETFIFWVRKHWREDFEKDLQGLATDVDLGDLLTTWIPLVTLREDLCCRTLPRENQLVAELLDELRTLTREWRAAGVDTVFISGKDARGLSHE
jgi:hypothetical protein